MAPFILQLMTLTAGFMVTYENLPGEWKGVYWINPFRYMLEAIVVNQVYQDGDGLQCALSFGAQNTISSKGFLETYSWDFDNRWRNLAILAMFGAVFRVGVLFGNMYKKFSVR